MVLSYIIYTFACCELIVSLHHPRARRSLCADSDCQNAAIMKNCYNLISAKNCRPGTHAVLRCVAFFLFLAAGVAVSAGDTVRFYDWCARLPSDRLVSMGDGYSRQDMHDSALVCYKIVTARCGDDADRKSGQACVDAYAGEWRIHFFHFFNYSRSLECLFAAESLAGKLGLARPDIYMDLGVTYHTIAEECNDTALYRQALAFYSKAVDASFNKDLSILNITMTNLIITAHVLDSMEVVRKLWDRYSGMGMGKHEDLAQYNRLLYASVELQDAGRYDAAADSLIRQIDICGRNGAFMRYLALSYINIGDVYLKSGRIADAVAYLRKAEEVAVRRGFKDARLEVYRMLSDCYRRTGDTELFADYKEKYFNIKDTLLNSHQLKRVSEVRFLGDMKKMDDALAGMKYRHDMLSILFCVFIVVFIIVSGLVCVLFVKNRRLKQSYRFLCQKNVEMLQTEEDERLMRKGGGHAHPEGNAAAGGGTARKSVCNIENADDIYGRIRHVMESNDAVFSPDFTAETLASLVGVKQRVVSQVIRCKTSSNFYSLLSDYRVKEACKRFRDEENYSRLTIEAVAHSVGFKSRSNFCSTFKSIVGLNPSEYIKMVRDGV